MSDNTVTIGANTITFSDGTNTRTITLDATNNTVSFATPCRRLRSQSRPPAATPLARRGGPVGCCTSMYVTVETI